MSEFSRRELADLLHVSPTRFLVAPCGSDHVLDLGEATPADVPFAGHSYALLVGNQAPHKNLVATASALVDAGIPTVVVGGSLEHVFRGHRDRGG